MKFNLKNLSENTKRIRIIPKNGTVLVANIGVDNPTAMIDEDGVFSVCLSPNETPTINCDDSPSSIILPLSGGALYEIVDGDAIYSDLIRYLIVGARDQNYFEGLRFEVVTGTDTDPMTVRIVNLTDNAKRIKFNAIDAAYLDEETFDAFDLNYAETVSLHNVVSVDNNRVFEFCLGAESDDEIPPNEMYFTTTAGSVDYVGTEGDQILLSDGTILEVPVGDDYLMFNAPSGKHKVKFVESTDRSNYVSLGGEALVEIHNFPTLSSVKHFNTWLSPNLVKVPTILPSNITRLASMFYGATSFNQDISMWDTSNVTDMTHMFEGATKFNQPIGNWNTNSVINMTDMFKNAKAFNQDIGSWDVSNVSIMNGMFGYAVAFNQDISSWNVSNVTEMVYMFNGAIAFNQPLNNWDISNVNSIWHMFQNAIAFNQPLNNWDISNVNNIQSMFNGASAFDQDISSWDVSNVTHMEGTFYNATSFNQDIGSWNVSNVVNMDYMFYGAASFNQDLSSWCVSNIPSKPYDFDLGVTNWTLPRPVWGTCPAPIYGDWTLNEGFTILGDDIRYTGYKTNGVDTYDSFALSSLQEALVKSFLDTDLQQYGAFTNAVEQLTGTVDWVMDNGGQIQYPDTSGMSTTADSHGYKLTSPSFPGEEYYFNDTTSLCRFYASKMGYIYVSTGYNFCTLRTTPNSATFNASVVPTSKSANPNYDPNAEVEGNYLPLTTVAQKVISNAESGEDEVLQLLSQDYVNLVANSIFDTNVSKQFVKLEDLIPQLEANKVLR